MAIKNGTVAIFKEVSKICGTIKRYDPKIRAAVAAAEAASIITSAQAATAIAFLDSANAVCTVFALVSGY
jgi:hypothetical protein